MSRSLFILIIVVLIISSYFLFRNAVTTPHPKDLEDIHSQEERTGKNSLKDYKSWVVFSSPNGNFKVLFPSRPQHITDKIADPRTKEIQKYDMYVSADNSGSAFVVSEIKFPAVIEEKNFEGVLTEIVDDMLARNKDNKLKMKKTKTFQKNQALEFTLENKDVTIGGIAFIKNDVLYVLSMISKLDAFDHEDFDFFVNSFELK